MNSGPHIVRAGDDHPSVRFTIVSSSFDQPSIGPSAVEPQSYSRTRSAISPTPTIRLGPLERATDPPPTPSGFLNRPAFMPYRIALTPRHWQAKELSRWRIASKRNLLK